MTSEVYREADYDSDDRNGNENENGIENRNGIENENRNWIESEEVEM